MSKIQTRILMALLFLSTVISIIMLYIAVFVRQAPKSLYFSYMILSVVFFNLGYLFELSGGGYDAALLAAKIEYLGIPFITPFLFLFAWEYCAKITVKLKYVLMLMIIPVMAAILVITWPWSDIYYKQLVYEPDAIVPRFIVTGGVFYYIYFAYTQILALISMGVVIYYCKKGDAAFKRQTSPVVIGTALPLIACTINIFKITNLPIDPTPILLSFTCVLLGHAIIKRGLYRLAPIAQEQIVENMNDGLILMDMQGRFIEANSAAKKLFTELNTLMSGSGMPHFKEITWEDNDSSIKKDFDITSDTGVKKYYQASLNSIEKNGKTIGKSITIHDVTDAKERLDEVRQMAERDTLTGLINRGTLYEHGKAIFAQFSPQSNAAVLMMDIDFFKMINDTYGHLNGDEVLKKVAKALASRLRATDLVGRYGGEEFCVFLPYVSMEDAMELAEKLRKSIESLDLTLNGNKVNVTISAGIAVYDNARHKSFELFLSDADAALYEAKNSGRNCVKRFYVK